MEYVDRIKLGTDNYTIKSSGVIDPANASNTATAEQIKQSVDLLNITSVEFAGNAWVDAGGGYYTNTKSVQGVTQNDNPIMSGIVYPQNCSDSTRKAIQKVAGCICELTTNYNSVTIKATRRPPAQTITIALRGLD